MCNHLVAFHVYLVYIRKSYSVDVWYSKHSCVQSHFKGFYLFQHDFCQRGSFYTIHQNGENVTSSETFKMY